MAKKKPKPKLTPPANLAACVPLPDAARMADVSERHMRLLVTSGRIPAAQIGRNYLVCGTSAAAFKRHPAAGRPRARNRKA